MRYHKKYPGKLARGGLQRMEELVGQRYPAGTVPEQTLKAIATVYLHSNYLALHPAAALGLRNLRELRTLASVVDHILMGNLELSLDVLFQRWKSIERAVADGAWSAARWHELIPTGDSLLVPRQEQSGATKDELLDRKLKDVLKKGSGRSEEKKKKKEGGGSDGE